MTDRLDLMSYAELETRLADLATVLAFPATPELASAIGPRLRAPSPVQLPIARPLPIRRSLRRSLLLAAALALLVVGGAVAVRLGLELLQIRFGPVPTLAPPTSAPASSPLPASALGLGRPTTLDEARAAAAFDVLVPASLGPPDVVYFGGPGLRGQVAFAYAPRDNLPASSLLGGAALVITQNEGEADKGLAQKLVDSHQASVEPVDVDGAAGIWISGGPHIFWYIAKDGTYIQDSRRVVGDTLAWERDGILYRIEGAVSLDQALEIARSME